MDRSGVRKDRAFAFPGLPLGKWMAHVEAISRAQMQQLKKPETPWPCLSETSLVLENMATCWWKGRPCIAFLPARQEATEQAHGAIRLEAGISRAE
jgi:hypothetical protein